MLNLVRVNRIFFEFLHNKFECVREPKSFPFKSDASLKFFKMQNSIFDFLSRLSPLSVYGVVILTRALVAESHRVNY